MPTSNLNLNYSKDIVLNDTPEKMLFFSVLTFFITVGIFLILSVFGVFNFIPNYNTSKIIILIFAVSWNFLILVIIFVLFTNSNRKKELKSKNSRQFIQESQSYLIEMDQITQSQDYMSPQFIETKKKLIRAFYIMSFTLSFVFLILLVIGVFLILYSVGVLDFGSENPSFNILRSIFAGFWNIILFFAFIKIIISRKHPPANDKT